jgi:hypothetical protein
MEAGFSPLLSIHRWLSFSPQNWSQLKSWGKQEVLPLSKPPEMLLLMIKTNQLEKKQTETKVLFKLTSKPTTYKCKQASLPFQNQDRSVWSLPASDSELYQHCKKEERPTLELTINSTYLKSYLQGKSSFSI